MHPILKLLWVIIGGGLVGWSLSRQFNERDPIPYISIGTIVGMMFGSIMIALTKSKDTNHTESQSLPRVVPAPPVPAVYVSIAPPPSPIVGGSANADAEPQYCCARCSRIGYQSEKLCPKCLTPNNKWFIPPVSSVTAPDGDVASPFPIGIPPPALTPQLGPVVRRLLALLHHPDAVLRKSAGEELVAYSNLPEVSAALKAAKEAETVPRLLSMLHHPDAGLRQAAVEDLAEYKHRPDVQAALAATKATANGTPASAATAEATLAKPVQTAPAKPPRAPLRNYHGSRVDYLLTQLDHEDDKIRQAAIDGLYVYQDIPEIARILKDEGLTRSKYDDESSHHRFVNG